MYLALKKLLVELERRAKSGSTYYSYSYYGSNDEEFYSKVSDLRGKIRKIEQDKVRSYRLTRHVCNFEDHY